MKNILFIILFSLISLPAFCQLRPHFFGVNAGISMPVAEYKNFDSARVSATKAGKFYSFEGGYYVSKIFGFGLNVGVYYNQLNEKEIIRKYAELYTNEQNITVNKGEWENIYAMTGIYITIPIQNFRLDLKFMGGAVNTSKPVLAISSTDNNAPMSQISTADEALAFGINYGANLRIKLISKLGVRVGAETFTSLPEFKIQTETNNDGKKEIVISNFDQTVSVLNLSAGLVFTL